MLKKLNAMYLKVTLMLTMCLMMLTSSVFASTYDAGFLDTDLGSKTSLGLGDSGGNVDWPWTRFLNSLAKEVTGPLPMVVGILAVCGAGFALLFGNGGAGTQKALTLICVVGVIMFTPTLVTYIYRSATGATIDMVVGVSAIAPPLLP